MKYISLNTTKFIQIHLEDAKLTAEDDQQRNKLLNELTKLIQSTKIYEGKQNRFILKKTVI